MSATDVASGRKKLENIYLKAHSAEPATVPRVSFRHGFPDLLSAGLYVFTLRFQDQPLSRSAATRDADSHD